jgi:hypothetical protein
MSTTQGLSAPLAPKPADASRQGDWMQTYTGGRFWPLDPHASEVNITDIAHALSLQSRFGGHCLRFYSVAEHCVHLARAAAPEDKLWALLHDASEAYVVDVPRPLKRFLAGYAEAETRVMGAICKAFDLPPEMPATVKALDNRILIDERYQVMIPTGEPWFYGGESEPLGIVIEHWSPERAAEEFLATFFALVGPGETPVLVGRDEAGGEHVLVSASGGHVRAALFRTYAPGPVTSPAPAAKPSWIERAAWVAEQLIRRILAEFPDAVPERDPDGMSAHHLLFMAQTLARRELDSETKACRWLGWLQAGVTLICTGAETDLEAMKELNLASADIPPADEEEWTLVSGVDVQDGAALIRTYELGRDAPLNDLGRAHTFQARVWEHCEAVAEGDPTDLSERRDRFTEEALELIQAYKGTREGVLALVDYVFSREVGHGPQEFGGTATTLAQFASIAGEDLLACGERELARTWQPEVFAKIRRKRAARHGRGTLPGVDGDILTTPMEPAPAPATGEATRLWWPADYGCEGGPPGRMTPEQWLCRLDNGQHAVGPAPGDAYAKDWPAKAIAEGEDVEFTSTMRVGMATFTIAAEGYLLSGAPEDANGFIHDGDWDSYCDHVDIMADQLRSFHGEGEYEVECYRTDDPLFRFDLDGEGHGIFVETAIARAAESEQTREFLAECDAIEAEQAARRPAPVVEVDPFPPSQDGDPLQLDETRPVATSALPQVVSPST